jgi:branched-chain amino acid aminotransferase
MTLVWLNGRIVSLTDAHISVTDRGFLLGDGLFETMPVYMGRVFDLDAHLERLASGLAVLKFAGAVDLVKLRAGIADYLAAEEMVTAVLRLTVTRGAGPRGLLPPEAPSPALLMTLSPMPPLATEPLSLHIAAATRRNEFSPLSRIKALPYLDNVLALQEARDHGADEAILLNVRGTIACATAANIFAIRDGRLETPPLSDGALPGTMRALVLALANRLGLAAVETSLRAGDLAGADEVFLTNSIRRVTPVKECNGKPVGGRGGRALERLHALIAARMGLP